MTEFNAKLVLQQNFLFRDLPVATIEKIALLSRPKTVKAGKEIFRQGQPGDALYAVISGQVGINTMASDGDELALNIMEPGDTFGEIAIIDGEPRTATARMMSDGKLLVIERKAFLNLLRDEPEIAIHLMELFCGRLRFSTELAEDAAFLPGRVRLAKRLVSLAENHGRNEVSGITLKIKQSELAQFLGLTRQAVNQYLGVWGKDGWIELSRGKIIFRDIEALKGFSQSSRKTEA